MKRGEVVIRGTLPDGTEGPIDLFDLSDESCRALYGELLSKVARFGTRKRPEDLPGEDVRYRHKDFDPASRAVVADANFATLEARVAALEGKVGKTEAEPGS